jgi:hypothetical protein
MHQGVIVSTPHNYYLNDSNDNNNNNNDNKNN